jgi:hypothetical protein
VKSRHLALAVLIVLFLAGCGDGDDTTTTITETGQTTTTAESASPTVTEGSAGTQAPPMASGAAGSMTVDGETFEGQVIRCEPFSFGSDPHEDDVSVVLIAGAGLNVDLSYTPSIDISGSGEYLQASVDLLYSAPGAAQYEASAATNAAGEWIARSDEFVQDPTPLPTTPITRDGDRLTGGMTLDQSWPQGETGMVDVEFSLEIPPEITGC